MKKKIISVIFVIAVAATAAWNVSQNNEEVTLSDLAVSNIEALAYIEKITPGVGHRVPRIDCFGCPTGYNCWDEGIINCG